MNRWNELFPGLPNYSPSGRYRRGMFFKICDAPGYFNLRDVVRLHVDDQEQLYDVFEENPSTVWRSRVEDFIVHVLLASINSPCRG